MDERGAAVAEAKDVKAFDAFVAEVQDRIRLALTPLAGSDAARLATNDGLLHVWQRWDRVSGMANPAGYLYTVARSRIRADHPLEERLTEDLAGLEGEHSVEPALITILAALPERQRVAVYLVHGCRWPLPAVADLLGISVSTVRSHAERGLKRLQHEIGTAP